MSKEKTKTYRSPKLGLVINAESEVKRIEFVNGEFKTDDPKQQKYLESHRGFGLWIFADEQPPEKTRKKANKVSGIDLTDDALQI